jgi:hypothetical protein
MVEPPKVSIPKASSSRTKIEDVTGNPYGGIYAMDHKDPYEELFLYSNVSDSGDEQNF